MTSLPHLHKHLANLQRHFPQWAEELSVEASDTGDQRRLRLTTWLPLGEEDQ